MSNFRRSERYRFQLDVRFKATPRERPALTHDLSVHGVFIRTDEPRAPNQLVKFSVLDPERRTPIDLLGIVARCVPPEEASHRHPPGIGVSLFGNARDTEARWASIVAKVKLWSEQGLTRAPGAEPVKTEPVTTGQPKPRPLPPRAPSQRPQSVPPPSAPPPPMAAAAGDDPWPESIDAINRRHMRRPGPFNVTLRPEGLADLAHFEMRDISEGGTFVLTTQLLPISSDVRLHLVHPVSGQSFQITGQVVRTIDDIDPQERGIGVRFNRGSIDQKKWDEYVQRHAPVAPPKPILPTGSNVRVLRSPLNPDSDTSDDDA